MALATTRERRSNAGNRMNKLIGEEEEDDFYTTTYGGFNEEEEDKDYASEKEVEDVVDSDFDIDETDEVKSDHEDADGQGPRRVQKGVVTKAYKEPVKKKTVTATPAVKVEKKQKKRLTRKALSNAGIVAARRRSTLAKSAETARRQREREQSERRRAPRRVVPERKMTQEEILEEAKATEQENLKTLEKYLLMEIEKKKLKPVKKEYTGPMVRYHSVRMPLIEEVPVVEPPAPIQGEMRLDDIQIEFSEPAAVRDDIKYESKMVGHCERTFISFSEPAMVERFFPNEKPKVKQRSVCPITRLPARYFDPITRLPYANLQAIKVLREAYYQQLELKGNRNIPEVARWIKWRQQQKERRAQLLAQRRQMAAAAGAGGSTGKK
ncbi:vacuolar protein sorting-associated protein 72 homolog [Pollicipes pollicipes]|uniref:vacuolar protein sorting-associated protein 72 homolog n=1 Tax=Pollicipes pollicipes TaxID=41117 RepID=UPI001884A9A8|nr:vacuolar protein sorting-associated protein 72 homolog [Pollicipes pollicipes]